MRVVIINAVAMLLSISAFAQLPDFNGDRKVDFDDFFQFVDQFGKPVTSENARFDITGDGLIDFDDFFRFVDSFGQEAQFAITGLGSTSAAPGDTLNISIDADAGFSLDEAVVMVGDVTVEPSAT